MLAIVCSSARLRPHHPDVVRRQRQYLLDGADQPALARANLEAESLEVIQLRRSDWWQLSCLDLDARADPGRESIEAVDPFESEQERPPVPPAVANPESFTTGSAANGQPHVRC